MKFFSPWVEPPELDCSWQVHSRFGKPAPEREVHYSQGLSSLEEVGQVKIADVVAYDDIWVSLHNEISPSLHQNTGFLGLAWHCGNMKCRERLPSSSHTVNRRLCAITGSRAYSAVHAFLQKA